MVISSRFVVLGLALPFLLPAFGCAGGKSSTPAAVKGTVTYNGAKVTGGNLVFFPEGGGSYEAEITADGTYSVNNVPAGNAVVTVSTDRLDPSKQPKTYGGGKAQGMKTSSEPPGYARKNNPGTYVKIPEKYKKQDTGYKVTVKSGSQTIDIELKD